MEKLSDPEKIVTLNQLRAEVEKVFLIKDKYMVDVLMANIVGNRMDTDPFWLLIVGASSSGKSEFINMLNGFDFVHPVSDLTTNSFASGMLRNDVETSLLHVANNGIIALKDFTSILSKESQTRQTIMGQFREIFDGSYNKKTGTGQNIDWNGKIGVIAGVTEVIYRHLEVLSAMGDRFIMYNFEAPDRIDATKKAFENAPYIKEYRDHLQKCFFNYGSQVLDFFDENYEYCKDIIKLDEKVRDEIMTIADFATSARSAVLTDFKSGLVDFVPSKEFPMRMASQLQVVLSALLVMQLYEKSLLPGVKVKDIKLNINDDMLHIITKMPFDSIPRTRRDVLIPLAKYKQGVTTKGLATFLNLPTESVKKYLTQINALGICTRAGGGGPSGDEWKLKEKYREIIVRLEKITVVDAQLDRENDYDYDGQEDQELDSLEMDFNQEDLDQFDDTILS